jgi:predicted house-cleaning noncanonical NTP pyrophosphatase (MazG superfamily)
MLKEKLVRDKIPDIIKENGEEPVFDKLDDSEIVPYLIEKVSEEAEEFVEGGELEELADLLEVIDRFLELKGIGMEELQDLKEKKHEERGGFSENIVLRDVR